MNTIRRIPPIGLILFNFFVLLLVPSIAPLIATASYVYYIIRNDIRGNYFINIYIALICGYFSLNIFSASVYEGDLYEIASTPSAYLLFIYTTIAAALITNNTSSSKNSKEEYIKRTDITLKFIILFCVLPIAVTLKIIYIGVGSGADYGTQEWRSIVGNSLNGIEWMLYKTLVVVPALIYMLPGTNALRKAAMYCIPLFLLTAYGGRFLLFSSLLLILPLSLDKANKKEVIRLARNVILLFFGIVSLGAARYAIESNGEVDVAAIIEAIGRQSAGPVYDFLLSYGLADTNIAGELVYDRLRVAIVPGLFKYEYDQTLGGYLAIVSGRGFEFGHRIGGPGEAFYLAGHIGVILYAVISVFIIAFFCDRMVKRTPNRYIEASLIFFSLVFASLIDFSNLPNLIYITLIAHVFCLIYKALSKRSYEKVL